MKPQIRLVVSQLDCAEASRDHDDPNAIRFRFSRRVTDDELEVLSKIMKRAAECLRH